MANGLNSIVKRTGEKMGSRRIFTAHFKLQVLDSYRADSDCKGNQRATARKYGIHRRQIQKWLQAEKSLRTSVGAATAVDGEAATLDCARQGGAHASCVAISQDHVTTNVTNGVKTPTPGATSVLNEPARTTDTDRIPPPSAPMDLTIKKPCEFSERLGAGPQVLDLTCRKRTHSVAEVSSSTPGEVQQEPAVKTVKLFKPYLLTDDDDKHKDKMAAVSKVPAVVSTTKLDSSYMPGAFYPVYSYPSPTYTYYQQVRYSPCYDSANSFSPGSCYDEDCASLSPDSENIAVRQRHSYLDFNMAAVDSYYYRRQDLLTMRYRFEASPPLT